MSRFSFVKALVLWVLFMVSSVAHSEGGELNRWHSRQNAKTSTPIFRLPPCPKSASGWPKWRDSVVNRLLTLHSPTQRYLYFGDVMERSKAIVGRLRKCSPPESIMGNLLGFVQAQKNASDHHHQYGHRLSDKEYLKLTKAELTLPCLLRSPEFLRRISNHLSYRAARAMIEDQNRGLKVGHCPPDGRQWVTLVYRSRYLGTPDNANTFGRFFVMAPGDDYDRWIQFGIWLPEDRLKYRKTINNVSIVAVAKSAERFDALMDWYREPRPGSKDLTLRSLVEMTGDQTDNCQRCHKTIPQSIYPEKVYDFGDRGKLWEVPQGRLKDALAAFPFPAGPDGKPQLYQAPPAEMVAMLNTYVARAYPRAPLYEINKADRVAAWTNYGPPLGPEARRPESMRACTAGLSKSTVDRVRANMNCAACHDGSTNGALNFPLATETRASSGMHERPNLIGSFILDGYMPLEIGTNRPVVLSHQEREVLYKCVSLEYFDPATGNGLLKDWLRNEGDASPGAAGSGASNASTQIAQPRPAVVPAPSFADCLKCHGHKDVAPSLNGVFGRRLGSLSGFVYSPDLSQAGAEGAVWSDPDLMAFLKDPDSFLTSKLGRSAQSNMSKQYPDEAFRAAIVLRLKTLK